MTKESQDLICVGVISGAHGVQGEVLVKSFTEDPATLLDYLPLTDKTGKRTFDFALKKVTSKGFVMELDGVSDRNGAEALRQTKLYCPREVMDACGADEFYYVDLEGLKVRNQTGEVVGIIMAVHDYGAGAYIEGKTSSGKTFTVPFTKEAVPEVIIADGYVVIQDGFMLTTWKRDGDDAGQKDSTE